MNMKKRTKHVFKKATAIFLMVALIFGFSPIVQKQNQASASENSKAIILGAEKIAVPSGGWTAATGNYLYFGAYSSHPIKYRVISNSDTNMLLDSDDALWEDAFDDSNRQAYATSNIRDYLKDGKDADGTPLFTAGEQSALVHTSLLASEPYIPSRSSTSEEYLDDASEDNLAFLLTAAQVNDLYPTNEAATKSTWWWLRSADTENHNGAVGYVDDTGALTYNCFSFTYSGGVCPASNLDTTKVLFTTQTTFDKTKTLAEVSDANSCEWKPTIKDSTKTISTDNANLGTNNQVSVPVTISGTNIDQVSVFITNDDISSANTEILYYGKLAGVDPSSTNKQTGTFTLPNNMSEASKIYVVAEDINTSENSSITDFSSEPAEVIFAEEEEEEYKIVYDLKGGNEPYLPNKTTYTAQTETFTLNNPTKANLNFSGWTSESDNITTPTKEVSIEKGSSGNKDFAASWEANVVFDSQGGTSIETQTVAEGDKATKPSDDPTKEGLTFAGWYKDKACSNNNEYDFDTAVTKHTTLYAKWTAEVTFDTQGGTPVPSKQIVKEGDCATLPVETITKHAYIFDNWYESKTYAGSAYNFSTPVTKNMTLYAKWSLEEYKIVYYGLEDASVEENPDRYTTETETFSLNNPTKEDYVFIGWTSKSDNITTPTKEVSIEKGSSGNKDFTASWKEKQDFDSGQTGSDPTDPDSGNDDTDTSKDDTDPTKDDDNNADPAKDEGDTDPSGNSEKDSSSEPEEDLNNNTDSETQPTNPELEKTSNESNQEKTSSDTPTTAEENKSETSSEKAQDTQDSANTKSIANMAKTGDALDMLFMTLLLVVLLSSSVGIAFSLHKGKKQR